MIAKTRSPVVGSAQPDTARFTTHPGRTGTLLSVAGKLDAANPNRPLDHVDHPTGCEWLVLDLAAVEFVDAASIDGPRVVNIRCAHFDVRWSMVAGQAVSRRLRDRDRDGVVPVSGSLTAALASLQEPPDWRATTTGVAGSR
ncbi:hypothetical protein CSX11_08565 [Mycobacterium goodii]|nr:hypothetical protein CSX11_08565 [Mycolicibacterium goodii]